jgi:hypothetical protein
VLAKCVVSYAFIVRYFHRAPSKFYINSNRLNSQVTIINYKLIAVYGDKVVMFAIIEVRKKKLSRWKSSPLHLNG